MDLKSSSNELDVEETNDEDEELLIFILTSSQLIFSNRSLYFKVASLLMDTNLQLSCYFTVMLYFVHKG